MCEPRSSPLDSIDEIESRITQLESTAHEAHAELSGRLESLESDAAAREQRLDVLQRQLQSLHEDVLALREEVATLNEQLADRRE